MFTKQDVLTYVQEENVQFVRLAFCDVTGQQKNLTILPDELERAFTSGISFDASAIRGFGSDVCSDLFLIPDPVTLSIVPWQPLSGKMVRMYCSIARPDGSSFGGDSRLVLHRAVQDAEAAGIRCNFGAEFEFYLFQTDEGGNPTSIPFDHAGYMDFDPGDKCESIRREICFNLVDMGIQPECAHHEEGPGQNEIDFRYSDAMTAADNAATFQSVVSIIAIRNGVFASFDPKPLPQESGNGMHINISVESSDGRDLSDAFMAGILEHISEMTVFMNPTDASYRRLGEKKAPRYISWSPENRSQLIRIPATRGGMRRIELRSPDPGANPYLAYALLIRAGLDGIRRNLTPMPPSHTNLYTADEKTLSRYKSLPSSLAEAARLARESAWLREILPANFLEF